MRLCIFFLLFSLTGFAQHLTGTVINGTTEEPMEGVNVLLLNSAQGVVTAEDGSFSLPFPKKISEKDVVLFSFIGFQSEHLSVENIREGNDTVRLYEKTESLQEVTFRSKKNLQKRIHYHELAKMPVGISSFGAQMLNNKIYTVAGDASIIQHKARELFERQQMADATFADFIKGMKKDMSWLNFIGSMFIYDMEKNEWKTANLEFDERAFHRMVSLEGKLYVLGGNLLTPRRENIYLDNRIEIYDPKKDSVEVDFSNPHQAANFAAVVYDGKLLVMGGSVKMEDGGKICTNKVHVYDPEKGYWYELGGMPEAKETSGIRVGNKIYLIGGYKKQEALKSIDSYDPNTGRWKQEASLPEGLGQPALATDGRLIYICNNESFYTYEPETSELKEYYIDLGLENAHLSYKDGKLYLLGGFRERHFKKTPSSRLYLIDTAEFGRTIEQEVGIN